MADLNALMTNPNILEFLMSLKPLLIFIAGIVIYSIFVFKFYRFVARKNIFNLKKIIESVNDITEEGDLDSGRLEGLKAFSNKFTPEVRDRTNYWLKIITRDLDLLSKCKNYKEADKLISIVITDFKFFNDSVKKDYDACVSVQKAMKL